MTRRREDPSGALLQERCATIPVELLGTARVAILDVLEAVPATERTARHLVASAGAVLDAAHDVLVLRITSSAPGSPTPPPLDPSPPTETDTRNPSPATP